MASSSSAFTEIEDEVGGFQTMGRRGVDRGSPGKNPRRAASIARGIAGFPSYWRTRGVMGPRWPATSTASSAIMRVGGFSFDLIHHSLHALGSRMYGFAQELTIDDGDGRPAGEDLARMREFVPNLAAMLEDVVHDDPDSTLGWCDDQTEFDSDSTSCSMESNGVAPRIPGRPSMTAPGNRADGPPAALVQPAPPDIDEAAAARIALDGWVSRVGRGRSAVTRTATS